MLNAGTADNLVLAGNSKALDRPYPPILAVTGPARSGKSTLARLVAGKACGRIVYQPNYRDVNRIRRFDRDLISDISGSVRPVVIDGFDYRHTDMRRLREIGATVAYIHVPGLRCSYAPDDPGIPARHIGIVVVPSRKVVVPAASPLARPFLPRRHPLSYFPLFRHLLRNSYDADYAPVIAPALADEVVRLWHALSYGEDPR